MSVSIPVNVNVTISTIRNLLTCAIEGGSNYWGAFREDPNFIKSITEADKDAYVKSEGGEYYACYDIKNPYYCLRVSDAEGGTTYNVTLENLIKGLGIMANRYPRHFKDVINENYDAVTGDVFVQCSVFGEIVFG